MITTNIPDPQATLERLQPITTLAYNGLEIGTMKAQEYFAMEGAEINPYLASMLARFHAKRYLEAESKVRGINLRLQDIPNIGLRLAFAGHSVWIMKAQDGELPPPGWSSVKQEFYNQIPIAFPDLPAGEGNLIILWDATRSYQLIGLSLVCPRSGSITKESIDSYWEIQIPAPAMLVSTDTAIADKADALEIESLDEITLIACDKAKGESEK